MEDPSLSSPISAADSALAADSGPGGSFKGEGPLTSDGDAEFGFGRAELGRAALVGTVGLYERHLFLCYKSPDVWPSHVEAAEFDRLPRLLSAALAARKPELKKRTRLTICEGEDGTESSNGDVLIFPDMIRYRRLTHFDVDNFVEEVLVKDTEWLPGAVETMTGSHVFVCAHGSRDRRCGVCGPVLIKKFKEEISSRGLQDQVFVSPCSHIGGHKYAGNVIIFNPNVKGEVAGHWYGYVTPDDVTTLLEQHIGKGEIIDRLWRGQMGLSEDDQKRAQTLRAEGTDSVANGTSGCCGGAGNSSPCCQDSPPKEKLENNHIAELETEEMVPKSNGEMKVGGNSPRKMCRMPTWFDSWEPEDTYVTLAVVAAVASVVVAYGCYRQLK